ncbi:MAG: Uma2 family endonuclease [Cyanobacteriota bacterium]|nr:Uma2 family endonuclease [Cyanobacteriota bacterium]
MVTQVQTTRSSEIIYPDSDGLPMAENTVQFRWILVIQQNLAWLFANETVFVAGDLSWYPVEGRPDIKKAPDVMVAFGRPRGDRGSYKQWEEDNIPPQVVFEILSPGNPETEMARKLLFYDRFGVEEYYVYDPETNNLQVWLRGELGLDASPVETEWVSPRLNVRFEITENDLILYRPDGQRFLTYEEISQQLETQQQQLETQQQQLERERQRADRAEQAKLDAVSQLLAMGLTPEQIARALGLTEDEVKQARP